MEFVLHHLPGNILFNYSIGPSCSNSHIPGYINHKNLKSAGNVFVIAVNDPFVTKAWGASLDPNGSSGVRCLDLPVVNARI